MNLLGWVSAAEELWVHDHGGEDGEGQPLATGDDLLHILNWTKFCSFVV